MATAFLLEEGEPVAAAEGYFVAESGVYEAGELVPCKKAGEAAATCAFLAEHVDGEVARPDEGGPP